MDDGTITINLTKEDLKLYKYVRYKQLNAAKVAWASRLISRGWPILQ
jgi:hypothetical protein